MVHGSLHADSVRHGFYVSPFLEVMPIPEGVIDTHKTDSAQCTVLGAPLAGRMRRRRDQANGIALPEKFIPCPIRTTVKRLDKESEIRAYKLGKKRWSYNQCEVKLRNPLTGEELEVVDCMQYGETTLSDSEQKSGVTYQVRLKNGYRIKVNVFAVYDCPREVEEKDSSTFYEWPCITREACKRPHCQGAVLRTIQRFGKLGKRSGQNAAKANGKNGANTMKDAKYMFISIDEAGSHVKVKHFRLIAGMYVSGHDECLGSAVSAPIRVLANNDVPTGAAYIGLVLHPRPEWEGWKSTDNFQPRLPDSMRNSVPSGIPAESHSLSSNETDYRTDGGGPRPFLEQLLVQHAHTWHKDPNGAEQRMRVAIQQMGYNNDSATSPAQAFSMPHMLNSEEEALPFQVRFVCYRKGLSDLGARSSLLAVPQGPSSFGMQSLGEYSPDMPRTGEIQLHCPMQAATANMSGPMAMDIGGMSMGPGLTGGMSMNGGMGTGFSGCASTSMDNVVYNNLSSIPFSQIPIGPFNPFSGFQGTPDRDPNSWITEDLLMLSSEETERQN